MLNRSLHLRLAGGVGLIVLTACAGAYLLVTGSSYTLSFLCLLFILLITLFITRWITRTNEQTTTFFDSLKNRDTSMRFPETGSDPFLANLHREMNLLIDLYGKTLREEEERRLYYDTILRVLTHEIRNSITPITSLSADLLKHQADYPPGLLQEGLEVINSQAQNLSSFLDAYYQLTHLPQPEKKEVDLPALFRKLERLLSAGPDSPKLYFHTPAAIRLQADPALLTLALINLIGNALQAIAGQEDGRVTIQAAAQENGFCITVTDNGPGILPELVPDIFTPFFTTKPGGNGIGLSISQRIAQLHGGKLSVSCTPRIHTVFTMQLPQVSP